MSLNNYTKNDLLEVENLFYSIQDEINLLSVKELLKEFVECYFTCNKSKADEEYSVGYFNEEDEEFFKASVYSENRSRELNCETLSCAIDFFEEAYESIDFIATHCEQQEVISFDIEAKDILEVLLYSINFLKEERKEIM